MKKNLKSALLAAAAAAAIGANAVNPVFPGWYADPEGIVIGNQVWVFPTLSRHYGDDKVKYKADMERRFERSVGEYALQTHFDAFSSPDLVNWTKHSEVLHIRDVPWVKYALWAPAIVSKDGKYYLYFGGNDIQSNDEVGGIGVAVADTPEGPFKDAIGRPLISQIINGAQPIDQFVFLDDDGQYYMYYGGWGHCNVVKLNDDLISLGRFDDGDTYKEITPKDYVEGPFMLKRNGKYYFMWSEGGWTGPNYRVAYAIAESPLGPFERIGTILQQDPEIATGAGHHSVIQIPGTEDYYIVYHRRPLDRTHHNERATCIDKLEFDADGLIRPVKMTFTGPEAITIK